jgi:hypothetical protein
MSDLSGVQTIVFIIFAIAYYFGISFGIAFLILTVIWALLRLTLPLTLKQKLVLDFPHFVVEQSAYMVPFLGICYLIYTSHFVGIGDPEAELVALIVCPPFLVLYQISRKIYLRHKANKNALYGRSV